MADEKQFIGSQEVQVRCDSWVKAQNDILRSPGSIQNNRESEQDDGSWATDSEFDSVSECGTKRRRLAVPIKDEILNLVCKWKNCHEVTTSMDRFVKHVSEHIPELEIELNENGCQVYVCSWKDCSYETSGKDDITRHVNYHSFHAKLQSIGANIKSRIKLPVSSNFSLLYLNFLPGP